MTGPEESTTETHEPAQRSANPRRTATIIVVILIFAIFFWLYASKIMSVRSAEREGVADSAVAFAAASLPLVDLRSKNLLGDAETLQRVVDIIVESHRFSFAAVLDNQGRVIVASNRSVTAGSAYPDFTAGEFVERGADGKYEVIQPIEQGSASYGAVVLRQP